MHLSTCTYRKVVRFASDICVYGKYYENVTSLAPFALALLRQLRSVDLSTKQEKQIRDRKERSCILLYWKSIGAPGSAIVELDLGNSLSRV